MKSHARVVVIGVGITGCRVLIPTLNEAGRLVLFEIDAEDADPWGGEPVLHEDECVGYPTSAGYGHTTGRTLALGYVRGYVRGDVVTSNAACDVEVIGRPVPARRLERPPVDPEGRRIRG